MSAYSGPNVPVTGSLIRFDSANLKSKKESTLKSVVNNTAIPITSTVTDGFITSSIIISSLNVSNINNYNALSVACSIKTDYLSEGTIFSIYGEGNRYYIPSGITTLDNIVCETPALSTVSHSYTMSPSTLAIFDEISSETLALSTVSHSYTMSPSTLATLSDDVSDTPAISTVDHNYIMEPSTLTTLSNNVGETPASSEEIYYDLPDYGISSFIENGKIKVRVKDEYVNDQTISTYVPTINDVFIFVIKKAPNVDNVKIYHNGIFLAQNAFPYSLNTFGTNLNMIALNSQGNKANFPVRFMSIYQKELTPVEIRTISTGIRRSL